MLGVFTRPVAAKLIDPELLRSVHLAHIVYSIGVDTVDPVFFAVVPDSFMTGETGGIARQAEKWDRAEEWSEEQDQPLLSPHDRWSF